MIKFEPFIGESYRNSCYGVRVLVLGISHYGDPEDNYLNFTQDVVSENAYTAGNAFFTKLTKVLRLSEDNLSDEDRQDTWKNIAFYNYIQDIVGDKSRIDPTDKMWKDAFIPFQEVVNKLEPDIIVVLGDNLWDQIPNLPEKYNVEWCGLKHPSAGMTYGKSIAEFKKSLDKAKAKKK